MLNETATLLIDKTISVILSNKAYRKERTAMSNIYKIGDVSKILNISSEMIRYYEKCGFIKPDRNNNKCRKYTLHDIFALTECLYYTSWKIKIADIKDSIYATSNEDALKNMCLYRNQLEKSMDIVTYNLNHIFSCANQHLYF